MDNAKALYETLLKGGKDEIDKLIADNATEHFFLDFKQKRDSDGATNLEPDDRKNLGKALSGFANSQGGVLVWGVKKTDGVKGEMEYKLIKKPNLLVESLNRAVSELVTPYVDAVDSKIVFDDHGSGIVATYIPSSEKTPHRSLRDHKYYLRIGDSFRIMEHFQLEDMFGRRSRPKLSLQLSVDLYAESKPVETFRLNLAIHNSGRAIAHHYGFDLEFPVKTIIDSNSLRSRPGFICKPTLSGFGTLKYRNSHDQDSVPIYPEETIKIATNNYRLGHVHFKLTRNQLSAWKDHILSYTIYCENTIPKKEEIKFGDLFNDPRFINTL